MKLKSRLSVETTKTGIVNWGEKKLMGDSKKNTKKLTFGFCSRAKMQADHAAKLPEQS